MGMFDYYEPEPPLQCPKCNAPLRGWQGKDACCCLFMWTQGNAAPLDQIVDDECKATPEVRAKERLPERFEIYTTCARCRSHVDATGFATGGTWEETVFGRHGSSASVKAWFVHPGWRQCSQCADAWEDRGPSAFSECPSCKALTKLDDFSRSTQDEEAG